MSKLLRKGDQVVVIAGNDRGKVGLITSRLGERVVIEGINVRKKHMKRTQEQQKGQIVDMECPIHISNVRPYANDKAIKLRTRFGKDGKRECVYRDGKKEVLYRELKKKAKK